MHDNERYFFEALRAGASGYVLKAAADRDLVEACRATMRGEPFLYPGAVRSLMKDFVERARRGETPSDDPLTPREVEIVKLIAEARTHSRAPGRSGAQAREHRPAPGGQPVSVHPERPGDLVLGHPGGEHAEHGQVLRAELSAGRPERRRVERAQPPVTERRLSHRIDELGRVRRLRDDRLRAGDDRQDGQAVVREGGVEHHRRPRGSEPEAQREAVDVREVVVGHQHRRFPAPALELRQASGGHRGRDAHVGLGLQERGDTCSDGCVVVDDDDLHHPDSILSARGSGNGC